MTIDWSRPFEYSHIGRMKNWICPSDPAAVGGIDPWQKAEGVGYDDER